MPTDFQMGFFLPDICWISDGMRQVVLGWKLLKADRKIMPGQQALLLRTCPSTGRVFSPTPQRKVTGWQVIPMLISEEAGISGLLGTRGDLDRPTRLPRIFWSGTNLSHSPVTTTGPQLRGTRCQGGSRWKRDSFSLCLTGSAPFSGRTPSSCEAAMLFAKKKAVCHGSFHLPHMQTARAVWDLPSLFSMHSFSTIQSWEKYQINTHFGTSRDSAVFKPKQQQRGALLENRAGTWLSSWEKILPCAEGFTCIISNNP